MLGEAGGDFNDNPASSRQFDNILKVIYVGWSQTLDTTKDHPKVIRVVDLTILSHVQSHRDIAIFGECKSSLT